MKGRHLEGGGAEWGPGWNVKNVLERAGNVFSFLFPSHPVLTFKCLIVPQWIFWGTVSLFLIMLIKGELRGMWKLVEHKSVSLLQQAVQLFPNCGVGNEVKRTIIIIKLQTKLN